MSPLRRLCLLTQVAWLLAGCSGPNQAPPSATASLQAFATATPSRTPTLFDATPRQTVELEPSPTPFVHVVAKGETLLEIAIRYGVDLDKLLAPQLEPGKRSELGWQARGKRYQRFQQLQGKE